MPIMNILMAKPLIKKTLIVNQPLFQKIDSNKMMTSESMIKKKQRDFIKMKRMMLRFHKDSHLEKVKERCNTKEKVRVTISRWSKRRWNKRNSKRNTQWMKKQ